MPKFTAMPPEKLATTSAQQEVLFNELHDITAAAGESGRAGPCPNPPGRPRPVETQVDKPRMSCPLMTPEEFATVSVDMLSPNAQQQVQDVMEKHGMAVVLGVTTAEENRKMEQMWQHDLLSLAGDSLRDDPPHPSSVRDTYQRVASEGVGHWPRNTLWGDRFSFKRGLTQGAYAWAARLHPNVRQVFAWLHECEVEDLCTGMDAIFFNPEDSKEPEDDKYWMHVDYNQTLLPDRHCYQGILYTWGSESPDASTTVIWPGSHKDVCDAIQAALPHMDGHFLPHRSVPDESLRQRLVQGGLKHARRIPVPAGALLLFSSRTSHQGWEGGRRLAAPVCWEAKHHRLYEALRRKMWLAAAGLNSNHWASLGIVHTSQPEMLVEATAVSGDGQAEAEGPHSVLLPCYPSIFPYTVRPEKAAEWQEMMPKLWTSTAKHSAQNFRDTGSLKKILRQEVLDVL